MSTSLKQSLIRASHQPISQQIEAMTLLIEKNPMLNTVFAVLYDVPDAWLGAGCIIQNVWNVFHDQPLNAHLKDIDILYYDADTSWEAEDRWIQIINERLKDSDIGLPVDIKNVARIHLWYGERFKS